MNKVCHITSAHPRYDIRIFKKECMSLRRKGFDVYLIVNDDLDNEVKNGIKIISTQFQPQNRKERMIDSIKLIVKLAERVDADIYHVHDPELLQIVKKLKKANRKVIFDAHEDTAVEILDKEWIPFPLRHIIAKVYSIYEKFVLKRCTAVITVTPALVNKLKKYNSEVIMITNYPIIEERMNTKIDKNEKYIFFAGGVSRQWCHDRIIRALSKIDGVTYIFAGMAEKEYMKYLRTFSGWEKAKYLGKIPHEEVECLYQGAIAGMAINECSQIKGEGTLGNTKLFEVMAAGVPVICTDYRLWKQIVEGNHCGICVNSSDIEQITEAVNYLYTHPIEAEEMGKNGKKAVEEKYNWKNEEVKLFDLYERLLEEEKEEEKC